MSRGEGFCIGVRVAFRLPFEQPYGRLVAVFHFFHELRSKFARCQRLACRKLRLLSADCGRERHVFCCCGRRHCLAYGCMVGDHCCANARTVRFELFARQVSQSDLRHVQLGSFGPEIILKRGCAVNISDTVMTSAITENFCYCVVSHAVLLDYLLMFGGHGALSQFSFETEPVRPHLHLIRGVLSCTGVPLYARVHKYEVNSIEGKLGRRGVLVRQSKGCSGIGLYTEDLFFEIQSVGTVCE